MKNPSYIKRWCDEDHRLILKFPYKKNVFYKHFYFFSFPAMKNQIPINSCETGKNCSSCSPCTKKIMLLIPLIIILFGGYYVYTHFFATQSTTCTIEDNTCEL